MFLMQLSCDSRKTLFEMEMWWDGHWQNMDEPAMFFSVGSKPIGKNEIVTTQFFISDKDSIYANFYMKSLVDFDHRKGFKLIKTNEDTYLRIQEINDQHIEVYGPSNSTEELETKIGHYTRLPLNISPPFPDSILRQRSWL